MKHIRPLVTSLALLLALGALVFSPATGRAATAAQIDSASRSALRNLYSKNAKAREVGHRAVAVLVFPSIVKGGFLIAAHHGDGALLTHHGTLGYYKTVAASYGLQAGVQTFGYALFFTRASALSYLHRQGGWDVGSAPSLVVVDKGTAGSLNTTNLNKNIYAFFFNQKGLMGGLGLQGSKITEIHPN
jgi:lipid-binding SYLF domain-containing protein